MNAMHDPPSRAMRWRASSPLVGWVVLVVVVVIITFGLLRPAAVATKPDAGPTAIDLPPRIASIEPRASRDGREPEAARPTPSGSPGAESMQLCGGEWVKLDNDGNVDDPRATRLERDARARALERLRASTSELDRALAAWLGDVTPLDAASAAASAAGCVDRDCQVRHVLAALRGSGERVAHLAASTRDPLVYALAYAACFEARKQGNCALLSPEQWARLDPGNARPWLYAMQLAIEGGDAAARDEALHRIATSERDESSVFVLAARTVDAIPDDDASLWGASVLALEAQARLLAMSPAYALLIQRCRTTPQADANAWQSCAAAAGRLAEHSDSMVVRKIAVSMARSLGLPPERFDRIAGELIDAGRPGPQEAHPGDRSAADCGVLRRELADLRQRARIGEVAALRAARRAGPPSPEEAMRLGREERERREVTERNSLRREGPASGARAPEVDVVLPPVASPR